jgi:hypothetical protein
LEKSIIGPLKIFCSKEVWYFFQSNDIQLALSLGKSYRRAKPGEIFVNGLEATKNISH